MTRARRLLGFLDEVDADVTVLTETRGTPGTELLLDTYRQAGYGVTAPSHLSTGERGVAVVHRVPSVPTCPGRVPDLSHRLLSVQLELPEPITLVGAYVPSRDSSAQKIKRKQTFLSQMSCFLERISQDREVILMGDFNVVSRSHEPRYSTFRSWEYDSLRDIADCGLVDVFLDMHPGVQAHSWVGRTGDGYRYDYSFLSRQLLPRVRTCEYVNEPRLLGLTDHAGMLLSIGADVRRVGVHSLAWELDAVFA